MQDEAKIVSMPVLPQLLGFAKEKKKEGNLHLFQLQCFRVPQYKFLVYTILSPLPHMVNCTAFKQLFYKKIK